MIGALDLRVAWRAVTDVPIRPAGPDRVETLAATFARAFLDDPIVRWPLPDAPDVADRVRRVFATIYGQLADEGVIWEAGDAAGFAVWIPAGAAEEMFDGDTSVLSSLSALTADDAARYRVLWDWIEARVPDDVWYLDAIGVEPERQGRGVGAALIRHGLGAAAAAGVDAFLETGVARNVAYYERFGFRVIDRGRPAPGGPEIWFLRTGG
jgi:ribosomal protein S18 acetylase RimI-like enzyme